MISALADSTRGLRWHTAGPYRSPSLIFLGHNLPWIKHVNIRNSENIPVNVSYTELPVPDSEAWRSIYNNHSLEQILSYKFLGIGICGLEICLVARGLGEQRAKLGMSVRGSKIVILLTLCPLRNTFRVK